MNSTLEEFKAIVAQRLEIDPKILYGTSPSLRLSDVVARSPVARNSIDLMEAVAGAMAEMEIDEDLELPAMTLDNTVSELLVEIEAQLRAREAKAAS